MANLYGVANPVILPAQFWTAGFANINCPAGTETTVIASTAIAAISPGVYYPVVYFEYTIGLGATPPTGCTIGARIGAGSDFDQLNMAPGVLVASATLQAMAILIGPASVAPWQGAGSIINVTLAPSAQAVSCLGNSAKAYVTLYRAPDQ